MKKCQDCKKEKPLTEYSTRKNGVGETKYLFSFCKPCMTLRTRKWQMKNKDKWNEYQRNYKRVV